MYILIIQTSIVEIGFGPNAELILYSSSPYRFTVMTVYVAY
jgi:hypothetical protein